MTTKIEQHNDGEHTWEKRTTESGEEYRKDNEEWTTIEDGPMWTTYRDTWNWMTS